jgi:hypothetical protein
VHKNFDKSKDVPEWYQASDYAQKKNFTMELGSYEGIYTGDYDEKNECISGFGIYQDTTEGYRFEGYWKNN